MYVIIFRYGVNIIRARELALLYINIPMQIIRNYIWLNRL